MSVRIEELGPGWDFRYSIIDSRDGYGEKAYSREAAERIAARLAERKVK